MEGFSWKLVAKTVQGKLKMLTAQERAAEEGGKRKSKETRRSKSTTKSSSTTKFCTNED